MRGRYRTHEWVVIVTDCVDRVIEVGDSVYRQRDMWEKKRELRRKYGYGVKLRVIHQELVTDG